ncbi:Cyclophilin-type peptidyl-prolyl cis-trans isomerase [Parasponia andersonii]|uniref:Peptidyl-prolyl cis-trans isomerase n=1 Tax=Parasponia andersonii TaxID=3476 RepID=A0A2P5D0V3_PARAD|nr:Cyclophilin-type peptidyl-prolyl cis-trans isomerase [Parasponia andersonii]
MSVMIVTSLGDIVIDLYTDKCPLTSKNFLKLCKIKYYNGCLFHTVQKDFTAQTGDPTGTGSGGDSVYKFLYGEQARFFGDEIHLDLKHAKKGTVSMASAGENLNASQFYFTLRDDLDYLDGKHTIFGEVAEGFETLTRINEAFLDENGRPYKNIRIKHTYILDDPFDDPQQLFELIPEASPEGRPKDEVDDDVRLEDDWVPMDETLGLQELDEVIRAKEAHSSAVVLESIGDIPDADIKPPDNVLFVCKLNPVTEDEDLHTIFSRFGPVLSAEVIRDYKTGDSLCYAFIEFETKESCEQAYFKMDNALIDDRRIHVDFSQSVSKLWSQYRRKDHQTGKDERVEKQKIHRQSLEESRHRDQEKRDSRHGHRQTDKSSRDYRDVELRRERDGRESRPGGIRSSRDYVEEQNREKHNERRNDQDDRKVDERDYHKRSAGNGHHEERRDGKDYRKGTDDDRLRERGNDRDYRKRSTDNDSRAERRDDGDHRKRSEDYRSHREKRDDRDNKRDDVREAGDERRDRKRNADGDDYRDKRGEREHRRRETESADEQDRERRHRSDKRR